MAAITIYSDFGAQKSKVCHCFSICLPWSDGNRCDNLTFFFLILTFNPVFSVSSFTFIKRLFSSSLLSAIRVVSFAYLRLLVFLLELLLRACNSANLAFHMMYSAYHVLCISWEMLGWMKHKLESRLPGKISITSDMQMTPPLWQKVKRNERASWWKWKRRGKTLA